MGDAKERILATTVHVDGEIYEAGTSVPDEIAELITNPKAWGEEPVAEEKVKRAKQPKAAKEPKAEKVAGDELAIPSKVAGSSEAWRDYALAAAAKAGLNIEIPEGTKRGEIISALTDAGVPTEKAE